MTIFIFTFTSFQNTPSKIAAANFKVIKKSYKVIELYTVFTLSPWKQTFNILAFDGSPGGGTRSENDHTFGPKFAFKNRTLTVQ